MALRLEDILPRKGEVEALTQRVEARIDEHMRDMRTCYGKVLIHEAVPAAWAIPVCQELRARYEAAGWPSMEVEFDEPYDGLCGPVTGLKFSLVPSDRNRLLGRT